MWTRFLKGQRKDEETKRKEIQDRMRKRPQPVATAGTSQLRPATYDPDNSPLDPYEATASGVRFSPRLETRGTYPAESTIAAEMDRHEQREREAYEEYSSPRRDGSPKLWSETGGRALTPRSPHIEDTSAMQQTHALFAAPVVGSMVDQSMINHMNHLLISRETQIHQLEEKVNRLTAETKASRDHINKLQEFIKEKDQLVEKKEKLINDHEAEVASLTNLCQVLSLRLKAANSEIALHNTKTDAKVKSLLKEKLEATQYVAKIANSRTKKNPNKLRTVQDWISNWHKERDGYTTDVLNETVSLLMVQNRVKDECIHELLRIESISKNLGGPGYGAGLSYEQRVARVEQTNQERVMELLAESVSTHADDAVFREEEQLSRELEATKAELSQLESRMVGEKEGWMNLDDISVGPSEGELTNDAASDDGDEALVLRMKHLLAEQQQMLDQRNAELSRMQHHPVMQQHYPMGPSGSPPTSPGMRPSSSYPHLGATSPVTASMLMSDPYLSVGMGSAERLGSKAQDIEIEMLRRKVNKLSHQKSKSSPRGKRR